MRLVDRRRLVPLTAVILLALVLRIGAIAYDTGYKPANDALEYDYYARSIAAGNGYPQSGYLLQGGATAIRGPGYPFLLGATYALSADNVTVGRLLGAALGTLAVLLLYLIVKRVWGRRVGLIAAVMAAIFPALISVSRDLVSEPLFIVLELAAVLCVLELRRSGGMLRWAAAAGGLCGLAVLTRPTGFVLTLAIALGAWTMRPRLRPRALMAPLVLLLSAGLVVGPWIARDAIEFGRFVPVTTSAGIATAGTYNWQSYKDGDSHGAWRDPQVIPRFRSLFTTTGIDEASVDVVLRQYARDFAWNHPGYVAETTAWNLLRLSEIVGGSVVDRHGSPISDRGIGSADSTAERIGLGIAVALGIIGLAAMFRSNRRSTGLKGPRTPRGPLFLWLIPILIVMATAPIAGLPRYRLPVDPFLLTLGAIGLVTLWDRVSASLRASRVSGTST